MDTHPVLEKVHRFEGVAGTTDEYYCYQIAERDSVQFNVRGVFALDSELCLFADDVVLFIFGRTSGRPRHPECPAPSQ